MKAEKQSRWSHDETNAFKRVFFALDHRAARKKSKIQNMQADTVDDGGADSSNSPFEVTSVEKTEKDKIDHTIHTGYFHTGEANTLIFIVEGGNAVSYFVMRSKIP